ncbi:P-loop NTPase [Methylomonas rivi]|uniref:SIR2 family protein n=1 Tax=Methylomonas rivi TaxID=2952226 RepID=A0ABT1U4M8_9GAMM|nr:SIR2 family protein [Methylomonas sp. WSC-6]MCQ8128804.1 SIR2 family protein [Methylomonas sp. WSC-6]
MISPEYLEQLRHGLFSGQYNLLLGSGISLDSHDRKGVPLKSAKLLTEDLCKIKNIDPGTRLQRVSILLNPEEIDKYLTQPYLGCRPGETVKRLSSYVWRNIFTFNIDDALEAAYESTERHKQKIDTLNYDTLYKTQPNKGHLSLIHLHGFVREPEKGYVFSTLQYGKVTRGMCAWMYVLSELIASEPFIISGTSLDEPDLEYYLAGRTATSGRTNRGPSFLIEPYPNKLTEAVCEQHGLILVESKLSDFLRWMSEEFGIAPTVSQLTVPSLDGIFRAKPVAEDQINFFSCFELVRSSTPNPDGDVPSFYFGKAARWSDLESSVDVPTKDERVISAKARNWLAGSVVSTKILNINAETGSGKTTIIRRVGYDLAKDGYIALFLNTNSAIDPENASNLISLINRPVVVIIDGLADHAPSIRSMVLNLRLQKPMVIVSADRYYRKDHLDRIIGDLDIEYIDVSSWSIDMLEKLIDKLHRVGLLAHPDAVHKPKKFASELVKNPIAIATCRALNNFKPLEEIVKSLWRDATPDERRSYAVAALAEHCYTGGILHAILEKAYHNPSLMDQLERHCPLPLTYIDDDDYIIPLHPIVADRLLLMLAREKQEMLLEIFSLLANALAPYVNRRTTIARTPEAKLAARLFSAEHVARDLLGNHADSFFHQAHDAWQWNPRYWEQRAILTQFTNLDLAIQYARHAVAIEEHPFPWTTLASLLSKKLEGTNIGLDSLYNEIFELINKVIKYEISSPSWRQTPHPFASLFHATDVFLSKGGYIAPKKKEWILQRIEYCSKTFSRDKSLNEYGDKILQALNPT